VESAFEYHRIAMKLEEIFYKMAISPAMLYGSKPQKKKLKLKKKTLRWITSKKR